MTQKLKIFGTTNVVRKLVLGLMVLFTISAVFAQNGCPHFSSTAVDSHDGFEINGSNDYIGSEDWSISIDQGEGDTLLFTSGPYQGQTFYILNAEIPCWDEIHGCIKLQGLDITSFQGPSGDPIENGWQFEVYDPECEIIFEPEVIPEFSGGAIAGVLAIVAVLGLIAIRKRG